MEQNEDGSFTVQLPLKSYFTGLTPTKGALEKMIEQMRSLCVFSEFDHPHRVSDAGLFTNRCLHISLENACAKLTDPQVTYDENQNITTLVVKVTPLASLTGPHLRQYLEAEKDPDAILFGIRGTTNGVSITSIVTWDFLGNTVKKRHADQAEAEYNVQLEQSIPKTLTLADGRILTVGEWYHIKTNWSVFYMELKCFVKEGKYKFEWENDECIFDHDKVAVEEIT